MYKLFFFCTVLLILIPLKKTLNWFKLDFLQDEIVVLPLRSYMCDKADPAFEYNIEIRNLNDEGVKVLDVDLEMEEDFTERWNVSKV